MDETRVDYLFECFRTSREEILFRIKKRDNLLQFQLVVQAAIAALSMGVTLFGISAPDPKPELLVISVPISLIILVLYHIEDRLIGYLSGYICSISDTEAKLRPGKVMIMNWDESGYLRSYRTTTLPFRLVAQITAFIVIPSGLCVYRFSHLTSLSNLNTMVLILCGIMIAFMVGVIFAGYFHRRKTGSERGRAQGSETIPETDGKK